MEPVRNECKYIDYGFEGLTCNNLQSKSYICPYYYNYKDCPNFESSKEIAREDINNMVTKKAPVITLCGSTRYKDVFMAMLENLSLAGWIVLLPGYYGHKSTFPITENAKDELDNLHKRKIDMSDAILVINVDGYIGDSTKSEIEYAISKGKEVHYYENLENKK